ncbi:hypothetical protein HPP92_025934 [Vanilla planifolia]|uniref:Uncharacterized protein n=1 Tax=Vanilla planifolia TaxID=51239 RepID=A0A835PI97_VANPL|nr:hypothetical protein HPP92_026220 [Vanilla planifolia]KAG0451923.1 hypothetical protein HPP92_025934 [Vanilla planifolia]
MRLMRGRFAFDTCMNSATRRPESRLPGEVCNSFNKHLTARQSISGIPSNVSHDALTAAFRSPSCADINERGSGDRKNRTSILRRHLAVARSPHKPPEMSPVGGSRSSCGWRGIKLSSSWSIDVTFSSSRLAVAPGGARDHF